MTDVITRADEKTQAPVTPPRGGAKDRWVRRAPLLPALVFALIVTQVPFLFTLYFSTQGWNALRPGSRHWVGLSNYKTVLTDDRLRSALLNTVVLTAGAVIFSMILGLLLAILLDRKFFGRSIVRTLMITPFLIMPVAAALLWKHGIFNPDYGLINGVFGGNTAWATSYPKTTIITTLVWQWTPFMMLAFFAGRQAMPLGPYRAAAVDGANAFQTFFRLTLPLMTPLLVVIGMLRFIDAFKVFDSVFILTAGGPAVSTESPSMLAYKMTFEQWRIGESAAMAVVVWVAFFVVCNVFYQVAKKRLKAF